MPRLIVIALFALFALVLGTAVPAQAVARCGPRGGDRVAERGAVQVVAARRGEDTFLYACRARGRAVLVDDNADEARVLLVDGRRALIATGFDTDGSTEEALPAQWFVSLVDFRRRRTRVVSGELADRPAPASWALTARGDVLWSEPMGYEVLRISRNGRITDLDAATARPGRRVGRVSVRGDRVRWTPPGLPARTYALRDHLRRVTACFPRGGAYLVVGGFGAVRTANGAAYFCAPGQTRRTRLGGACTPRATNPGSVLAWNDHLAWHCLRDGVHVVHVYMFSTRSLLLAQPTNLVRNDGVELTLSDFGAVAWVDRPARGGRLTSLRVFAPGQGVRTFDEGGERVTDPSWNGRTVSWLWFRTTSSPDVARSYTVP